ncbi:MAG: choice-of-anchor D domain-containing protein [Betaproteobacteria bacterium]|nr:choice-of-anchor D domain-containing protein [Betaproteobacteria bacterium]
MTRIDPASSFRNAPRVVRIFARAALCLAAWVASPAVAAAPSMQVWAGGDNTCAVVDGAAYCWGKNTDGQVGNATFARATSPTLVQGLSSGVSFIATSGAHSCAIVNGGATCWGNNDYGQLGNNGSQDSSVPVAVVGLSSGVTAIAVGDLHSCAVHNGAVKCWGAGGVGQLGTGGSIFSSAVPVQVAGLTSGATDVTTGRFNSCAIVNGGALCWGQGDSGEMGNGTNTYVNLAPVAVSGYGSGVTVLSGGAYFACGIQGAAARCWGFGTSGRLGGGNNNASNVPQAVVGLASGVSAITAGNGNHGCAVASGAAYCWGLNNAGQLGNPAAAGGTTAPIGVQGLTTGMYDVSAGGLHTCGLSDAGISCWGGNAEGQLGTGNQTASPTAVLVIAAPVIATALSASPAALDFGGQSLNTTAPAQLVTITNTGGTPITFTDASIAGDFSGATDCTTLAAGATCLVEAAFTPTVPGARTGRVNFVTTAGTFSISLSGIGELSLVTHYYRSILRRAPDAGGKAFWEGEAVRMQGLGANVNETWYAMATFFYFSTEYQSFNRDNAGFVTDLYNTFFNRGPDAGGLTFWTGLLSQGMPRKWCWCRSCSRRNSRPSPRRSSGTCRRERKWTRSWTSTEGSCRGFPTTAASRTGWASSARRSARGPGRSTRRWRRSRAASPAAPSTRAATARTRSTWAISTTRSCVAAVTWRGCSSGFRSWRAGPPEARSASSSSRARSSPTA